MGIYVLCVYTHTYVFVFMHVCMCTRVLLVYARVCLRIQHMWFLWMRACVCMTECMNACVCGFIAQ